jgi:hypothetical protein
VDRRGDLQRLGGLAVVEERNADRRKERHPQPGHPGFDRFELGARGQMAELLGMTLSDIGRAGFFVVKDMTPSCVFDRVATMLGRSLRVKCETAQGEN